MNIDALAEANGLLLLHSEPQQGLGMIAYQSALCKPDRSALSKWAGAYKHSKEQKSQILSAEHVPQPD